MVAVNPLPLTIVVSSAQMALAEWVDPLTRLVGAPGATMVKAARVTNTGTAPILVLDANFQTSDGTVASVLDRTEVGQVQIPAGESRNVEISVFLKADAPPNVEVAGVIILQVDAV